MRKVAIPPKYLEQFELLRKNSKKLSAAMLFFKAVDEKNRYTHWDKLRYKTPPKGLSVEDWWAVIKLARSSQFKSIGLLDNDSNAFKMTSTDYILQALHGIDCDASGGVSSQEPILNSQTRDRYLIRSLWEESISSSQLEGASTTHNVAKEMLRTKRQPLNKDEQMIYNNYLAMRFIQEHKDDKLTPQFICDLHRIVTEKTLEKDDVNKVGKLRSLNDDVRVVDIATNETLHLPPVATELPARLELFCNFANSESSEFFIHPVVKAIILHFMLAYEHPFVDGNGRTARALFYWYMAKQNYWLMEYCSISKIIKNAPAKYSRSFLYTESDESDLTYFVIHQLDVIQQAIKSLNDYIDRKVESVQDAKQLLRKNKTLQNQLNSRQMILLSHALKHPGFIYDIKTHQTKHAITYETARKDLTNLFNKVKLLDKLKQGRAFVFRSPVDLNERLLDIKK